MQYEIVTLQDKLAAGIGIRTNNRASDMSQRIGELWESFYTKGIYASIPNKSNKKAIGLYTNYASDLSGDYDAVVCCEVSSFEQAPESVQSLVIRGGRYAKFVLPSATPEDIGKLWNEIWQMPFERSYTFDFEEYQESDDPRKTDVYIYIALQEEKGNSL